MGQIKDKAGNVFRWENIKDDKYKYIVMIDYFVKVNIQTQNINNKFYSLLGGQLLIKHGYKWDGASGPTIDTHNTMRASCVHDVLYQMIRCRELNPDKKDTADRELQRIMKEDWKAKTIFGKGWNAIRSGYFYYAVKLFGGSSCIPGSQVSNKQRY